MNPPKKNSSWLIFKYLGLLLATILFVSSCESPKDKKNSLALEISKEERHWMQQFFNDLLLADNAIYTLWGSKPMTEIVLYHYTEEEIKAYYDSLTEEQKKDGFSIEDYSLSSTWKEWEKISDRFPMKRYMLFKSELRTHPKASFVYFVDILKTASVIQENYDAFQKAVGFDFNPFDVVLEMKSKESKFWKALEDYSSAVLWGLLFGFGKMNSYSFHWKYFDHSKTSEDLCEKLPSYFGNKPIRGKIKFSLENFHIPAFASFDEYDEVVEKYKAERKRIQQIYRGKNFLDLTLQKLTS